CREKSCCRPEPLAWPSQHSQYRLPSEQHRFRRVLLAAHLKIGGKAPTSNASCRRQNSSAIAQPDRQPFLTAAVWHRRAGVSDSPSKRYVGKTQWDLGTP